MRTRQVHRLDFGCTSDKSIENMVTTYQLKILYLKLVSPLQNFITFYSIASLIYKIANIYIREKTPWKQSQVELI